MGGVCSSATYKSTEPPIVSTLFELRSKQLISVLGAELWSIEVAGEGRLYDLGSELDAFRFRLGKGCGLGHLHCIGW